MSFSDLVTQKEAAAILNRSVSAVSRAIRDGRLEYADPKNRLLHRPGLEMRFRRKTRPRVDRPQRKTQSAPMQHEHQTPLYYVSQEPCSRRLSGGLNSAGNTSVTAFNNVTVAYYSLPKATRTAVNTGTTLTDREPIIPVKCLLGYKGSRDCSSVLGISQAKYCLPGIIYS